VCEAVSRVIRLSRFRVADCFVLPRLGLCSGRTAAAINAATLALIDAGVPMRDFVVCCHAGFVDNTPIVDLNYAEECSNCADMPVAIMPNCGDAVRIEEGADGAAEMAVETEQQAGDETAGSDGVAQLQASGDSIVMMQLDRRLPLEHFESLGAEYLHAYRTRAPTGVVLAIALHTNFSTQRARDRPIVALWWHCSNCLSCTVGVAADGARQIYALLKEVCSNAALCIAQHDSKCV